MTEEPRTEAQMRASAELVVDTCFEVKEGDGIGVPRHVESPITWPVEDGRYQAIESVAEFAFGTSDFVPLGDPSEKGRKGTVHFALGDNQNCYPGGQNRSMLHLDGVCHNVTLQILDTGEYLVKDGIWQL